MFNASTLNGLLLRDSPLDNSPQRGVLPYSVCEDLRI